MNVRTLDLKEKEWERGCRNGGREKTGEKTERNLE